ncbi:expansin-YoaJ-like [Littorina saxatilis]|uniref:Expansin-like EG45 domain-containing protein n=1 Tax=Littorina saxatilis TaxID=31220 RepID=A0AAN9B442_9CAEN
MAMPFLSSANVFNDRRIVIASIVVFFVVFVTIIGLVIYFYATKNNENNAGPAVQAVSLYQHWYDGDGTYYGSKGEGTCQISKTNLPPAARNAKYLVALNSEQFMNSAACGMCFRLKAEGKGLGSDHIKGDFIIFVKDLCPECKAGDIDLAEDGDGRWDIKIQAVQCPVGNTFIQYWLQGSNAFYLKLQVRNTRVPCKVVEVQAKNGQWTQMKLSKDGHWVGSAVFNPAGDVPVRLTSITGAVVNDIIPKLENQVVMEGKLKVQFPLVSSLPNA